jgi:hypothetical protein
MATQQKVKEFLSEFKAKMSIYGVIFRDDRAKNTIALLALDILPAERREILRKLEVVDYYQGPLTDDLYQIAPMWVFGKNLKGKEYYIKISVGNENLPVICISFHSAEFAIIYPFKI